MPKYPTLIQLKTVFPVIGVAVTMPFQLTFEATYVFDVDVKPAQSLTVNITYTYEVTVS